MNDKEAYSAKFCL